MNNTYNKNDLSSAVQDIIAGNYMDPDLNVSMVAERLNKSLDYVSKSFKKTTGQSILDCLQEYRIREAKRYLSERSDLSIREISVMVGYSNCESFIRLFKRKQGITPGRYKNILKNNE